MAQQHSREELQLVRKTLNNMQPALARALPSTIKAERFAEIAYLAVNNDPALLECDRSSLLAECMACARDGLVPDKKEAALVKFGNKVTYIPMVAGVLKKIRNSGKLRQIKAGVVHHLDLDEGRFTYHDDERGEYITYERDLRRAQPDNPKQAAGAYATAITTDGGLYASWMTTVEIEKVRQSSRARGGPWQDWWDQMACKTVLKRLAKRLPSSSDMVEFLARGDNEMYGEHPSPQQEKRKPVTSRVRQAAGLDDADTQPESTPESTPEADDDVVDGEYDDITHEEI